LLALEQTAESSVMELSKLWHVHVIQGVITKWRWFCSGDIIALYYACTCFVYRSCYVNHNASR